MNKIAKVVKQSSIIETNSNDTIRLWEGHKEQATLWRAIALLEIPATCLAIILAFSLWMTRSVTFNVPAKPLPGIYTAQEIPDSEFINTATTYINLIATYQPSVVRRQFDEARKMIFGQMLEVFDKNMLGAEIKAIETTSRTQIFFADPTQTKIERKGRLVTVSITGDRYKRISKKDLPLVKTTYVITMTTIPRNTFNPYGIVIQNVQVVNDDERGR